jgi:hypothetical protein
MYLGVRLQGLALVHGLDEFGTDRAEQMLPERLLVRCAVSSTQMTTTARFGCDAATKALIRFQRKSKPPPFFLLLKLDLQSQRY